MRPPCAHYYSRLQRPISLRLNLSLLKRSYASPTSDRIAQSGTKDTAGSLPEGVELFTADAIEVQKSSFVGRACRIADPAQVPLILAHILRDKKVAKAAHPVIHAWRCKLNGVQREGDDDDGETAAGDRLVRLLQLLDVNDVLVVVTRYFGGVKLGPSRFKHINQAARNALERGGFLQEKQGKPTGDKRPKR